MNPERIRLLRLQDLNKNNNRPVNGEQLQKLAKLNPLKLDDFRAIEGLGDKFINDYGQLFLDELRAIELTKLNNEAIDDNIHLTLQELEKKLINISARNRLLYLGKLSPNTSFDLYQEDFGMFNEFLVGKQSLILADLTKTTDETKETMTKRYKDALKLIKNIEKHQKDTGQDDLFVGYPFVVGQFINDPFTIRAPLALFPITSKVTNNKISVVVDTTRDVFINTNLLVAKAKFMQDNDALGEPIWEEVNPKTFVSDLIDFYSSQKLLIRPSESTLIPFISKNADSFKNLVPGDFFVEPVAVLGHFPNHASAIQRDFNQITKEESLPQHLTTLLETLDESVDSLEPQATLGEINYGERDLVFINALNASQEKALIAVKKGQSLVIEGPPGTGKSQTISNIIADGLSAGKKMLMVSEKKAAIDVVYSRLSNLNRYALILDNMNDKVHFYEQLLRLYDESAHIPTPTELDNLNDEIDSSFRQLEDLAQQLKTAPNDDVSLLTLYSEVKKMDYTGDNFSKYQTLSELVDPLIVKLPYAQLKKECSNSDETTIQQQLILKDMPAIANLNKELRNFDVLSLKQELTKIEELKQAEESSSFLTKFFKKPESVNRWNALLAKLFTVVPHDLTVKQVINILDNYQEYILIKPNDNPLLSNTIERVMKAFSLDVAAAKALIINFNGFEKVDSFESKNRDLIKLIDDFDGLIASINASHAEKSEITEQNLLIEAKKSVFKMIQSKRALEMQRIIERKRKWPIHKFIDKFSIELFNGIKVWLCTPDVVSEIFPLKSDLFDLVIFDEASQMYIERAIPSLIRGQQVVIAGDSKQLRPSSLGVGRLVFDEIDDEFIENTAALDEESLLDLARFRYPSTVLNYHYRSVYEELIAYSNAAFYQNELVMSPSVTLPSKPVIEVFNVEGLWQNRTNQKESDKVVELISKILRNRTNNETIGVITFNATQRQKIEDDLEKACIADKELNDLVVAETNRIEEGEDKSLFVKNIENVQGDERDIIIFSLAYGMNDDGKVITNFGWLNQQGGENRLNVAITRSKRKIYIVTSIFPHQLNVENSKYAGPRRLKDYLTYCYAVSEGNQDAVKQTLHSLYQSSQIVSDTSFNALAETFISALKEKGLIIETNLGLATYTIDVAIRKENRYQLAVFFDDRRYHAIMHTRTRDLHQDNYLKARGWKVKRIFMRDLYEDINHVVADVMKTLEMNQAT